VIRKRLINGIVQGLFWWSTDQQPRHPRWVELEKQVNERWTKVDGN